MAGGAHGTYTETQTHTKTQTHAHTRTHTEPSLLLLGGGDRDERPLAELHMLDFSVTQNTERDREDREGKDSASVRVCDGVWCTLAAKLPNPRLWQCAAMVASV